MRRLKGFTLIELLIVVAIIGILAAIAVPNFLNAQVRAKVSRAKAEQRELTTALEEFFVDNSSYPPLTNLDRTISRLYRDNPGNIDSARIEIGTGTRARRIYLTTPISYMSSIPFDPFRGGGNDWTYLYGSNGTSYYIIVSYGPDGISGNGTTGTRVGPLSVKDYTGAKENDWNRAAYRDGKMMLRDLIYDASNGTSSGGDIIKTGP
jgi:prepilin-type N-terminal cleavage/methylation domain-containing protein